jgi:hypothetical protein
MKLSALPVLARTFTFLVVLGGLGACAGGLESNAGQGGSSGQSGAGGGTGGSASCAAATGGSVGSATFADVKTVVGFYCGGTDCHNSGRMPNLFPDDDTTLYTTLTTYKVTKCGGRVLVKPCAPDDSAFYRAQRDPTTCEMLPQMPFGCGAGNCTQPDDLELVRQWIAAGAPKS